MKFTDLTVVDKPPLIKKLLSEPNPDSLWTVGDTAAYLKLEAETVRKMARKGKLPAIKVGRVWRFQQNQILAWLEQLQEKDNDYN